ncbi:small nuclear ribonucleoprotein G [Babesia microti strain RI]|uniref:Small nuclear ribonucleoprotein G n=1 Tax=Babesia microti (strain RI) TaxID=1133968 RepID=A0A0K3AMQ5_BABMR|nr:small nuclear ribonucleoprotein G [Babesia microti strain RI]CTQ40989.1 small nuclear ribonucleoprotein G [Babesia microti strain RI]|eukprot:XP_012649000.1 small nuclear ribonucleoprotein G [Babesia microti strain RI]
MAGKTGPAVDLRRFMEKRLDIYLNGHRHIVGVLRGYDTFMNIVLDNALKIGDEKEELGTVVLRGNSIVCWECLDKVHTR